MCNYENVLLPIGYTNTEEVGHDHVHYLLYCDFQTFLYMRAESLM